MLLFPTLLADRQLQSCRQISRGDEREVSEILKQSLTGSYADGVDEMQTTSRRQWSLVWSAI